MTLCNNFQRNGGWAYFWGVGIFSRGYVPSRSISYICMKCLLSPMQVRYYFHTTLIKPDYLTTAVSYSRHSSSKMTAFKSNKKVSTA